MAVADRRVLVIGLDGATFELIDWWVEEGRLPHIARLMSNGCRGFLASTLQPVTAPAWTTFMTGVNQGKHGLYDFVRRRENGYNLKVTNASEIAVPTLFDIASRLGRRVIAINVPYTHPTRPINGVLVGGPFAPAVTRDLVSPASLFDELQDVVPGYFVSPDFDPRADDPLADYAGKLMLGIQMRERLGLHLLKTRDWDLATIVFMATDEAQHAYWHCLNAPADSHQDRYRYIIRDVYQRVDQAIGTLLEQVAIDEPARETTVIILSDHGAGPLRWMINLNRFLADTGFLRFVRASDRPLEHLRAFGVKRLARAYHRYVPARTRAGIRARLGAQRFGTIKGDFESALLSSTVDWNHTRAYALGAGGNVYVNLKGREPSGIIEPGAEYERVRQEITDAVLKLSDPQTSTPIVRHVHRREELYDGPLLERAPDLIIEWMDYAYWGRGRYDSRESPVFETKSHFDFSDLPLSGTHRPEGILVINGPGVVSGSVISGARLMDLAPTILNILGIPIPEDMDGVMLHKAFTYGAFEKSDAHDNAASTASDGEAFAYRPEDEAAISQRLKDLGYL